jgi:hypothetical protein
VTTGAISASKSDHTHREQTSTDCNFRKLVWYDINRVNRAGVKLVKLVCEHQSCPIEQGETSKTSL